jgi:glycerol-3-phosphate dehydrogenase
MRTTPAMTMNPASGLQFFNKRSRPALVETLSRNRFDLLVIGRGVTGASIFRDAALRGMRVALVEAGDFAGAASGRSSKLIHGGLRYLKDLGFRLAWESCRERNLHLRLNKRLVEPLPFLVPLYRGRAISRSAMRLGMMLYEVLSGFSNHKLHRFLTREETLSMTPGLPAGGLTGVPPIGSSRVQQRDQPS